MFRFFITKYEFNTLKEKRDESEEKKKNKRKHFLGEPEKTSCDNFFQSQVEKDKLLKEKISETEVIIKPVSQVEEQKHFKLNDEEIENERVLREKQLEKIFELLKEEEAKIFNGKNNKQSGSTDLPLVSDASEKDCKFSILKEDGSYEEFDLNLKDEFQSQLKLYGL